MSFLQVGATEKVRMVYSRFLDEKRQEMQGKKFDV
jgi:hypothetical protein